MFWFRPKDLIKLKVLRSLSALSADDARFSTIKIFLAGKF
jgi:hypothetical protein